MARIAVSAQLGRMSENKEIGYRVLTVGRAEYIPFTTDGVVKTGVPYHFAVPGVDVPSNGGFIIWGTVDQDMAEATIEPMAVQPAAFQELVDAVRSGLSALRADLSLLQSAGAQRTAEMETLFNRINEAAAALDGVSETLATRKLLSDMRSLLNSPLAGNAAPVQGTPPAQVAPGRPAPDLAALERKRMLRLLDGFLAKVEGHYGD
mgnify:CR=1 FL=1